MHARMGGGEVEGGVGCCVCVCVWGVGGGGGIKASRKQRLL